MGNNKLNFVYTEESECKGCNKCVFKCPTKANKAVWTEEENKILIRNGRCISCSECIAICDHSARDYIDDTEMFFEDLKNGVSISMVVAPAAATNFEDLENIIGFLKHMGVNLIYDVSYGANICTWGYIRAIAENKLKTLIAQPCPVVVSYVEKYHSSLIEYLSPVHSPVACAAIYLKKYKNVKDKIAFLSPCIGKKRECIDPNTDDSINYNVTFSKFVKYIKEHNIDLDNYPKTEFDSTDMLLGFAFPRPGGLSENVRMYLGDDVWIKQIEGIFVIEDYFKQYEDDLKNERPVPLIVDALNCEHGCNIGTGTDKDARYNDIDFKINQKKQRVNKSDVEKYVKIFDETLEIKDFMREYSDKSVEYKTLTDVELENIYVELGKLTEKDRNINCFSCGYGTCERFVIAIANGNNHKNNCRQYLLDKFKSKGFIDDLTGLKNRNSFEVEIEQCKKSEDKSVGVVFVDINGLKIANDTYGHKRGDAMITTCSDIMKHVFPGKVFRVGGDEFVVIDMEVSKESLERKMRELRKTFENNNTIHVSIGETWSSNAYDIQDLIAEADQKMYEDKKQYYETNKHLCARESLT